MRSTRSCVKASNMSPSSPTAVSSGSARGPTCSAHGRAGSTKSVPRRRFAFAGRRLDREAKGRVMSTSKDAWNEVGDRFTAVGKRLAGPYGERGDGGSPQETPHKGGEGFPQIAKQVRRATA